MTRVSVHALLSFLAVSLVTLAGCASKGPEEPDFSLVEKSGDVEIRNYAPRLVVQTRVEGDQKRVQDKRAELEGEVASRSLGVLGPITLAQYDPPWTLWFLRRNEVMVPTAR